MTTKTSISHVKTPIKDLRAKNPKCHIDKEIKPAGSQLLLGKVSNNAWKKKEKLLQL